MERKKENTGKEWSPYRIEKIKDEMYNQNASKSIFSGFFSEPQTDNSKSTIQSDSESMR